MAETWWQDRPVRMKARFLLGDRGSNCVSLGYVLWSPAAKRWWAYGTVGGSPAGEDVRFVGGASSQGKAKEMLEAWVIERELLSR